jgi:hypothetical protein
MTRQDARKYYYQAKDRMWTLRRSGLNALFPDSYRAYAVEANHWDALRRAGRTQPR